MDRQIRRIVLPRLSAFIPVMLFLLGFPRCDATEQTSPPAPDAPQPPKAASRSFRMGFTGFPHDFSLEAFVQAQAFSRENADIIAHHIEGVPWAECLGDAPFSDELKKDLEGKKAATPAGGKVYLAISPGRGDLKPAEKSQPFPKELKGKAYDDPLVEKAYLAYCRRMLDIFKPDYLAIGIEVNEICQASPAAWKAYVALHRHVYEELKKEHPDLAIFASFTLHGMLNLSGTKREQALAAYADIMPHNDLVAVSFYPFIRGGTTDYTGCLAWLTQNFDNYHKPYAVVETGEAAERLTFPGSGQVIEGTPEKQAAYFRALLEFAQKNDTRFVISFIHRDYDALWEKIKTSSPELFMAWRDCGLVDEKGNPRPAYRVWREYLELPLRAYKGHDLPRLRGAMISPNVSEADLRVFGQQWKANHVRWQLLWGGFPHSPADKGDLAAYDQWLESALAHLDRLLPVCEEVGLRVLVDVHTPPGGRNEASECRIFKERQFQEAFLAGWDWAYHAFREWDGWSVEHGGDPNDHAPSKTLTDRELLLRSWFERN